MAKKVKSLKTLKSNCFESDIELLDEPIPTKTRHIEYKKEKPAKYKTSIELAQVKETQFGTVISDKPVPCSCNKCGTYVKGNLISMIFSPGPNIMTPFVSYFCSGCGHSGRRSVKEKALAPTDFEKYYF